MTNRTSPARVVQAGPVTGSYAALAALLPDRDASTPDEETLMAAVAELCAFLDTRRDCADFRAIALLAVLLAGEAPDASLEQARRSLVGFKYWMAEPGDDAMCFWSENHQLLFATAEYLAGATFPEEVFTNDRRTGAEHREDGRRRLERWLDLRFRFGFSEWLSPVYYEEDVAGLTLLVEHAPDPEVAERAAAVLDLLLLDCALHRFDGHLVASSGRVYELQKKHPAASEMQPVVDHAFTDVDVVADWDRIGMVFCLRRAYEVPDVLVEIAADPAPRTVRTGHGLDIAQAVRLYRAPDDPETTGALLWAMEAFVNPGAIRATMAAFEAWRMATNPFVSALRSLEWVPRPVLPLAMRLLRPVVAGTALERAHVTTTRSASYSLSCAQHYRPGHFGDQQHLWQVVLPGGVPLFATHPGGPLVDDATRQRTPSAWVGNGVNPDVGAAGPVLLALHDTRGRRGYGETRRRHGSHLYVPFAELDESARGSHWLAVRKGDALVGVLATSELVAESEDALGQEGAVTAWVVVCAEVGDHGSLEAFSTWLGHCAVSLNGAVLEATTPDATYRLGRGQLWSDGRRVRTEHGRYDSRWVQAPFDADRIIVRGETGTLTLGRDGSRVVTRS
ncbi:MAG TPA: hypothetical protein VFK68_11880 [Propionibacteriaceae bacterium]|nr:hypothetical protein [Propionibacteriaceae bacterium]